MTVGRPVADAAVLFTSEIRDFLQLGSSRAARVQLARWGIVAVGRVVGTGEKLWPADQVAAAVGGRRGRGARTDLDTGEGQRPRSA